MTPPLVLFKLLCTAPTMVVIVALLDALLVVALVPTLKNMVLVFLLLPFLVLFVAD